MSKRVLAKAGKTGGTTLASRKPDIKIIQAKVLEKAKKNDMTGKNFRMQNPKDKDVQALYKANPNLKDKDIVRQEGRNYQKDFKKAKTLDKKVKVFAQKKTASNVQFEKLKKIRDTNARAFKVFNGFDREGKIVKGELEGLKTRFDKAGGTKTLGMTFTDFKNIYKGPYYFGG